MLSQEVSSVTMFSPRSSPSSSAHAQDGPRTLFTTTDKLPWRHAALDSPAASPPVGTATSKSAKASFSEALMRMLPQVSFADAYSFDVPPDVRTGDDAVKLFSSSAAKPGLIIFANLNRKATVRLRALGCWCFIRMRLDWRSPDPWWWSIFICCLAAIRNVPCL